MNPNSLMNDERTVSTGFKAANYARFLAERFTIVNKDKQTVPFVLNPPQLDFFYQMEKYYQILILKARKMGFSSAALGVAATKFIMGKNENCVSMSFDADASQKQLERAKQYLRAYEHYHNIKIPFKYNRQNAMVIEIKDPKTGEISTNTLRVGTAKSTSFGRGDDITYLHLTEVAFCDDVPTLLSGVGEALVHGAHTIFETTANGFNSYKEFWDRSMLNDTGFAALFYSPEWEYDNEYLEVRKKRLGRLFNQEYPMTPEEAFIASGEGYFDKLSLANFLEDIKNWERINGQRIQTV